MNSRKYHRKSRNWNSGRLMTPSHQPASDGCNRPSARPPYQLVTSRATCVRQMKPTPTMYTNAISRTSAAIEFRRRMAETTARVKLRARRIRNQPAIEELPHDGAHPLVHRQLGQDHQRQREQQPDVQFHVVEQRQRDCCAPGAALCDRQHQQRHPRQQHCHQHAPVEQLQGVVGQARPAPELIQRPAEDQREVGRVLQDRFVAGDGSGGAHRWGVSLSETESSSVRG